MATTRVARVGWSTGFKLITREKTLHLLASSGDIKDQREPVYVNMTDVGDLPDRTTSDNVSERWWEDPIDYSRVDPNESRVRVITADGNVSREINASFDCDNETLPDLLDWAVSKRKEPFSTVIGTTDLRYVSLGGCVWSQLSLTGSANGLVTGSLSAKTTSVDSLEELTWSASSEFFASTQSRSVVPVPTYPTLGLVPYWQTGNEDVATWTINMSQQVDGKYLNNGSEGPMYFRVGPWEVSVTFETFVDPHDPQDEAASREIRLCAQRLLRPIKGLRLEKTTSKGGHNEPVRYSYSFGIHGEPASYSDDASTQQPFTLA
jgi:hypothetical protein